MLKRQAFLDLLTLTIFTLTISRITQCTGVVKKNLSTRQKIFIKMLCVRITLVQAHRDVIFIFRYNHKGKIQKRRYGLARHVKIDFCIFVTVQAIQGKNFTGKTEKILQEKAGREKIKKDQRLKFASLFSLFYIVL